MVERSPAGDMRDVCGIDRGPLRPLLRARVVESSGSRPVRGFAPDSGQLVDGQLFVGDSAAARTIRQMIGRLAQRCATTLIYGATGTGKEIVALLLHRNSPRARGPLVAVNCAAIPEALIEGELFGYVKGAFSSAVRSYPGKFGLADGGTLFLDEIGELSLAAQAKILRALESREVFALGSMQSRPVSVRVIAATNRDLAAEVRAGRFREDLYYRLAVVQLSIPTLAQRRDDIAAIARHLVRDLAEEFDCPVPLIEAATLVELRRRAWPGNVRELRNALEHAMVVGTDPARLCMGDLPAELSAPGAFGAARVAADRSPTAAEIAAMIDVCNGSKAEAARRLNMSRTSLYRQLQRGDTETALR